MSDTPEFHAWKNAVQRTTNEKNPDWAAYGGRGIKMCEQWLMSFVTFRVDMGPRPTPAHSLDRIDNDGPYAPENCRWSTKSEQSNNTRSNLVLTHDGETKTATDWAKVSGVPSNSIRQRRKKGWSDSESIWTPVNGTRKCKPD